MPNREPFEWIEIDVPRCALAYGTGDCAAVLGETGQRKCFNTRGTCQDFANIDLTETTTLRFSRKGVPLPKGFRAYPVLTKVSQSSTSVNIAGADPKMAGLGKRGAVSWEIEDFTDHDRRFDFLWSERVSGAAQADTIGYTPEDFGTFLSRLKARWPDYQGAAARLCRAYADGGVIAGQQTYHHVLKSFDGPSKGVASCEAQDILDLASPLCPKPSEGYLTLDLDATATTFNVTPAEFAGAYATSGRLTINSEIMAFTRSGATFTVQRGQRGTTARTHSQGDTVQQNFTCDLERPDSVARRILSGFTNVPASWVPHEDWAAEVTRWAASLRLTTDICAPTAVSTLLAELGDLGCNIIPDERAAKLRLRMNRPLDGEAVVQITDSNAYSVKVEDKPEMRLTQVLFAHRRTDPTKGVGSGDDVSNYRSKLLTVNRDALDRYGSEAKTRVVRTRWLDQGDNATAAIASWRMLQRYVDAPLRVTAEIDAKNMALKLADVVRVDALELTDAAGMPSPTMMQVIGRSEPEPFHTVSVTLQRFDFAGKYAFITENDVPDYESATDAEKASGAFMVGSSLAFGDGSEPYRVI